MTALEFSEEEPNIFDIEADIFVIYVSHWDGYAPKSIVARVALG
jgi:hypothetical protein